MGGFGHGISNVGSPMYIKFFAKKLDINTYKHRIINGLNVDKLGPNHEAVTLGIRMGLVLL